MEATTGSRTPDDCSPHRLRRVEPGEARLPSGLIAAAAALLPVLGLCSCVRTIEDPTEAHQSLYGAAGAGGKGQQADTVIQTTRGGAAGMGGMAGAIPQLGAATENSELSDSIADPGPLDCTAPDREQYKALHRGDAGEPLPGGETPDASVEPLVLGSKGMEHTVLVVFDKSGSMSLGWDVRNKWQVASDTMIEAVTPFQSYLSVGAILFPTDGDCGVAGMQSGEQIDFRPGADFLAAWETSMQHYWPDGGTPMSVALLRADQAIARACERGVLERPFKVVLLTDGEPNCDGDMELLTSLPARWYQHGIRTYVVGLPGSETARELLEAIARAGGTDTYLAEIGLGDGAYMQPGDPTEFEEQMTIICE